MPNLQTRIEVLEKRFTSDADLPSCILIVPESGRKNAEPDDSPIVRLTCNSGIYDRLPQESEESFVLRVAQAAKERLPSPEAVPTLIAITEKMKAEM